MELAQLQQVTAFAVRQRLAMMVNRYDVTALAPDGSEGPLVAFAQQKRMAIREQVTFFTDESQREVLFAFNARQALDIGATYDVADEAGAPIGVFRKDFGASLLRSTFHLVQPGSPEATGQERSLVVALVRRFADVPLPVHFDFTVSGRPVMSVTRSFAIRDAYRVTIAAAWLDRRLAIAMAVALDALMGR